MPSSTFPTLLLLRFEAPLQAWGLRARWDVRDTGTEPSKSGIIGLLACALGYKPDDPRIEAELEVHLKVGVREERPGKMKKDFQTIHGEILRADGGVKGGDGEDSTIVSPRQYLQDAAFFVVIGSDSPDLLVLCHKVLQNPHWPIYLGRKACVPTRPVVETLTTQYKDIEDALRHHPWDVKGTGGLSRKEPSPDTKLRCVLEDPESHQVRPDRVHINPARMYLTRRVKEFTVPLPSEAHQEGS